MATMTAEAKMVQRQAFAGLMWTKQFYHYGIELWLEGDPGQPQAAGLSEERPEFRLEPPL